MDPKQVFRDRYVLGLVHFKASTRHGERVLGAIVFPELTLTSTAREAFRALFPTKRIKSVEMDLSEAY
jgi:hypothetical protein